MTLSTIRAAIARLFHRSPTDTMPNNTALADATKRLTDATAALTTERQHTAAQALQLIAVTGENATLAQALDAEKTAHAATQKALDDANATIDSLPDAATVAAAVDAETQAVQVIGAGSPEAQAATPTAPVASA